MEGDPGEEGMSMIMAQSPIWGGQIRPGGPSSCSSLLPAHKQEDEDELKYLAQDK